MSRVRAALLHVLLAVAAFAVVSRGVAALRPPPADSELACKLDHLRRHPGRYDLLFVGSSAVYRQVVPAVVDAEFARRGLRFSSFNAGAPGMRGFEEARALEELLEAAGDGVRAVVVEPSHFSPELPEAIEFSERSVAWHTWKWTRRAMEASLREGGDAWEGARLALRHLRLFCWRSTSYGAGPRIVERWLGLAAPPVLSEEELSTRRGWRPLEEESTEAVRERRRRFLAGADAYRRKVERLRRSRGRRAAVAPSEAAWFEELERDVREAGAVPVWLVPPLPVPQPVVETLAADGVLDFFLSYADPDRFPEFFRPEARFDENHLGAEAARAFSRRLAADLAGRLGVAAEGGR